MARGKGEMDIRVSHPRAAVGAEAPNVRMDNRRWLVRLAAVAVVGAVAAGALVFAQSSGRDYSWSGVVEAHSVTVGSRVGGRVKQVMVVEGQRVAAGETLLSLEAGDLDARRVQAAGEVAEAEARLAKLLRGAHPEEINQARSRIAEVHADLHRIKSGATPEEISVAETRLRATTIQWEKATQDVARTERLLAGSAASRSSLDDARAAAALAQARRDEMARDLDRLRKGARPEEIARVESQVKEATASMRLIATANRPEDIEISRSQLATARGRLQAIEGHIAELTVRAPVSATVEALELRPGDIVQPDAPAAVLLEDDQVFVRLYVPETQIGLLREGQELPVTVDSFAGERFRAVVLRINSRGEYLPRGLHTFDDRANQLFGVKLAVAAGRERLRAGMAAFVTFSR
jgi:HlyD family secretion protein